MYAIVGMQVFLFLKIISFSLCVDTVHSFIGKAWQIPTSKAGSATLSLGKCGRWLQWLCDDAHNMVSKGRCLLRSYCQVRMPTCL